MNPKYSNKQIPDLKKNIKLFQTNIKFLYFIIIATAIPSLKLNSESSLYTIQISTTE